ncbi:hypothetical protein BDGGKGIB_04114 [Nodularia sphaerocarpa UHCC 0038]|nr:hypothetical protein BDGGKGIB_04114 [Nodularia sphaerocarpa UHCC 0038]
MAKGLYSSGDRSEKLVTYTQLTTVAPQTLTASPAAICALKAGGQMVRKSAVF